MKEVRVGCSGWVYASWRRDIYKGLPQARWLERYAELFDTVEVNATFYRLIKRSTVEGWVERTPPGFLFAIKGSRYLTHIRRLQDVEQGLERFWEPLEPLRESGKLGPVLWQLPGSFHRDDAVLAAALEQLPRPARHCFECLHHGARGRNGNYSATELDQWRRRIAAWRARRPVFAYLNNDWEEFAPPNAIDLRRGLSGAAVGVGA